MRPAICAMQIALEGTFKNGYAIRVQVPLALGEDSEPEPDMAVVDGFWRDYVDRHPASAVLVVEISDTTLRIDRGIKASIYAQAGIPEYWIVNLKERVVEVYREPAQAPNTALGFAYQHAYRFGEGVDFAALASADSPILVDDLLP